MNDAKSDGSRVGAAMLAILMLGAAPHCLSAADEIVLEVRETAGLARGSPVDFRLKLPKPVPRTTPFVLLDDRGGKVVAQFSPAGNEPMQDVWWIDFSVSQGPLESKRFTVRYGEGVEASSEGTGGHRLTENEKFYQITNAPYITWKVPRDLAGLVHSVDFPPNEHLLPDSPGLILRDRDGHEHVLGAGFHTGRVLRNGRRAVALRFEGEAKAEAFAGVRSSVDLLFPSPVSWVEVDWTIEDPHDRVAGLESSLRLALDPPRADAPTLVDFGAGGWVYATLSADQTAELEASAVAAGPERRDPSWRILRGTPGRLTPIAAAPANSGTASAVSIPEGWAHIMDRKRCLALAVDRFARDADDRISLSAKGEVSLRRDFAAKPAASRPKTKHFRFWLHFVFYPPQVSAATSPRAMQTPAEVKIIR